MKKSINIFLCLLLLAVFCFYIIKYTKEGNTNNYKPNCMTDAGEYEEILFQGILDKNLSSNPDPDSNANDTCYKKGEDIGEQIINTKERVGG